MFGPLDNRSLVTIGSRKVPTDISNEENSEPENALNVENMGFLQPILNIGKKPIDLGPIKNLGPGLYE